MKNTIFTGSGVAIITPMLPDGTIDYATFRALIDFQIENGTDAIVVCGTTGEASSLNDNEHLGAIEACVKHVNGRVPVIAGTGSNDTRHGVEISKRAAELGADALLQVTPYYNKTNQSGLIRHFTTIADAAGIPVILYNVPSRTGMTISPASYKELAQHPHIVATKEASGDISHIAAVMEACGDSLDLYSGNDDQIIPLMSLGGIGVISVLANVLPKETHDICALYSGGRQDEALRLQLKLLPLINSIFSDVNPIPVKEAVTLLGYNAGPCRLPLGSLSVDKKNILENEMRKLGLI